MKKTTIDSMKKRVASRIKNVLDETMGPYGIFRIRDFCLKIDVCQGLFKEYMSGRVMPPLEFLMKICETCDRELGYFYNTDSEEKPMRILVARSVDGAGKKVPVSMCDLIFETGYPSDAEWFYFISDKEMDFGIKRNDYIFGFQTDDDYVRLRKGAFYVFGNLESQDFEVKQCVKLFDGLAYFSSLKKGNFLQRNICLPLSGEGSEVDKSSFSENGFDFVGEIRTKSNQWYFNEMESIKHLTLIESVQDSPQLASNS